MVFGFGKTSRKDTVSTGGYGVPREEITRGVLSPEQLEEFLQEKAIEFYEAKCEVEGRDFEQIIKNKEVTMDEIMELYNTHVVSRLPKDFIKINFLAPQEAQLAARPNIDFEKDIDKQYWGQFYKDQGWTPDEAFKSKYGKTSMEMIEARRNLQKSRMGMRAPWSRGGAFDSFTNKSVSRGVAKNLLFAFGISIAIGMFTSQRIPTSNLAPFTHDPIYAKETSLPRE